VARREAFRLRSSCSATAYEVYELERIPFVDLHAAESCPTDDLPIVLHNDGPRIELELREHIE